eukprot:CAMPEP_0183706430 /NCGR_PEP_ID=MMETSP0737-20130205/3263_1 /TAXON_ID=385413 /ORGANISM="Thalassiosira miniscula, Strain CCMP1093" /LENGTH=676 /DNA_ID=CAMNT_0025933843 /DNA_START=44 /DNA_END=2074 /DNA_ORIENTATION=+
MAEDDRRKKKKKKKTRRNRGGDDGDEEQPLAIDQGEAEFANTASINADNEPVLVEGDAGDEEGQPVLTLVQEDMGEDAIPAPIVEPDANGGDEQAGFTEDGLAVAMAVDTANEDEYIYSAIEYDPDSKPPLHKNRRFRVYTCLAFVVVISVIVVVVVTIAKSAKGTDTEYEDVLVNGAPSQSPTPSPTTNREASGIREQIEAGVLQRGANWTTIPKDDPRYRALDWILHYDELKLESDDKNLYQRYVLALLAFALDSLAWYNCGEHRKFSNETEFFVEEICEVQVKETGQLETHSVWLTSTDECEWYGVICSGDGVVRGIELMGNDLIGEIPPEISQLRFLQYLALNGNCLYGTLPPELGKMPSLLSLEVHGNGLSGEVPAELYDANKLQMLNLAYQYNYPYGQCQMSNGTFVSTLYERGGVYSTNFNGGLWGKVLDTQVNSWSSMKGLHLTDNSFTGTIAEEIGDLKYLVFLRAQNNMIGGLLPYDLVKLKKLREVYLEKNSIQFDLPPNMETMEDLEVLRVNENEMQGQLPESLYSLHKLKELWLQDTLHCDETGTDCAISSEHGFEGTLSPKIGNLKRLNRLLIQNNPFDGFIPSEIGKCEKLSAFYMHKTNIGGFAPHELCLLRDKELNNEANSGVFYADCRPNNKTDDPFFACDCCSDCCDHTTKVCIADD